MYLGARGLMYSLNINDINQFTKTITENNVEIGNEVKEIDKLKQRMTAADFPLTYKNDTRTSGRHICTLCLMPLDSKA
jgi:hypothetical protein